VNKRNQVLTSYNHSIIYAIILGLSSSCSYFETGLFRKGIIFERGSLLLLASVSHSLLLFRIADWRSHQEGIKCAFLQESSLFLLVSASVLLASVSNSLLLFLRRLALGRWQQKALQELFKPLQPTPSPPASQPASPPP
jgi:hypothetical protein